MNAMERSVSSLSTSARTSSVKGLTLCSGPFPFCSYIHGPFSIRSFSGMLPKLCVNMITGTFAAASHEVSGGMP